MLKINETAIGMNQQIAGLMIFWLYYIKIYFLS